MKPKKQFRWALWWGLGITLVSIALMFIPGADGDNNSPVSEMLLQMLEMGAVVLIVVIGIVMPALEEFSFRMWGCGKTWAGITSSAMMALFISLTLSWVAGVVSLAIGLVITLMVKDGRKRLLFMMLFSSVLFMLAHTENYDGGVIFIAIALVEKFGFGLLASYLVINHNIFWSMAYNKDNSIPAPEEYINSFEKFPVDEVVPELLKAIIESSVSSKNAQRLLQRIEQVSTSD